MQYWFLTMVVENSWASKCLEAELKYKRLHGCILSTGAHPGNILACRHIAYCCKELSTHWVPWSSFGHKAPQKADCTAGRSSSFPLHMSKVFRYSATACQAPCAQWRQGENSTASAGRKSNPLSTIFSTNTCQCLQAEAYLGTLWTFLRVLLIYAHSAVSPILLLTKELMKSIWRPWASCKTQGGEGLVFSDSRGS